MILYPFFSYRGSKWRVAKHLPAAQYQTLIEPFAGSAGYALRNWDCDVILYDVNPIIVGIWHWLINDATEDLILSLPLNWMYIDELSDYPKPCRDMLGFWCATGQAEPRQHRSANSVAIALAGYNADTASTFTKSKREKIASQLQFIRHWRVYQQCYLQSPDRECTWYVDPPYQYFPNFYLFEGMDYTQLRDFVLSRRGQVIVSEAAPANWLPFEHLVTRKVRGLPTGSANRSYQELVWCRS